MTTYANVILVLFCISSVILETKAGSNVQQLRFHDPPSPSPPARYSPTHYPPDSTSVNNLTFALYGSGTHGIYNSSETPSNSSRMYNYCNMPHVRSSSYPVPSSSFILEHVTLIHRHHKRTPYSSNTFFREDISWSCEDARIIHYATSDSESRKTWGEVPVIWRVDNEGAGNPMRPSVAVGFKGSDCLFPQITAEGLQDSYQHGLDIASVYRDQLQFLPSKFDPNQVVFRVTNNGNQHFANSTSQVLGALIAGLYPELEKSGYTAFIQPSSFDSLEPTYHCSRADALKAEIEMTEGWIHHLKEAAPLFKRLDSISGIDSNDNANWHTSSDHYFDNLSSKQCHGKPLPCNVNDTSQCISQADADMVYRLGNYEYSYRYRHGAPQISTAFANLRYGAWVAELLLELERTMRGESHLKYRHHVAHDGSIAPLLGILQARELAWPGLGSELVFEVWREELAKQHFVRVLWSGQPLETSTPLGTLDMIHIGKFIDFFKQQLPSDLRNACNEDGQVSQGVGMGPSILLATVQNLLPSLWVPVKADDKKAAAPAPAVSK
ncbi:phosphoglycerate mutase-like protein [Meredithblackwellia eburnea MCA 4105]